uniref:(northern house mosquito) hypothetical protein n=1 Tax=Culex pipiens TaxID=7175 RepID=A0A8D8GX51_CULPI
MKTFISEYKHKKTVLSTILIAYREKYPKQHPLSLSPLLHVNRPHHLLPVERGKVGEPFAGRHRVLVVVFVFLQHHSVDPGTAVVDTVVKIVATLRAGRLRRRRRGDHRSSPRNFRLLHRAGRAGRRDGTVLDAVHVELLLFRRRQVVVLVPVEDQTALLAVGAVLRRGHRDQRALALRHRFALVSSAELFPRFQDVRVDLADQPALGVLVVGAVFHRASLERVERHLLRLWHNQRLLLALAKVFPRRVQQLYRVVIDVPHLNLPVPLVPDAGHHAAEHVLLVLVVHQQYRMLVGQLQIVGVPSRRCRRRLLRNQNGGRPLRSIFRRQVLPDQVPRSGRSLRRRRVRLDRGDRGHRGRRRAGPG